MALNLEQFTADIDSRTKYQRDEHPVMTRLVVLRVHLNSEFGTDFRAYDHELAYIEKLLKELLDALPY